MAYLIEIHRHPQVNLRVEVLPQDMASMSLEDMLAIGSVITAMPVVNAIPAVIAARPGIITYADLPTQASRHLPHLTSTGAPGHLYARGWRGLPGPLNPAGGV